MKKIILYYILHVKKNRPKLPIAAPFCRAIESQLLQKNVFWCLEGKELIKKGLLPKKKILQEKEDFFFMQRI